MGQDPHIALSEVWSPFSDFLKRGEDTGKAFVGENHMLQLTRYGYVEETYYSYRFIPIVGEEGYVVGHYGNLLDVTREVVDDRRSALAQHIGVQVSLCKSMPEFWPSFLSGFEPNEKDFPLVAIYSTSDYASEPSRVQSDRPTFQLEGCIGVSENHLPSRLILPRERRQVNAKAVNIEGLLASLFHESLESSEPLLVMQDMLPDTFLKSTACRGFGRPSKEFLVTPLRTNKGIVIGFIFAGLNPLKRFNQDNNYGEHVKMITHQVAVSKASSILQAEEITLGEEKLILRSEELKRSEVKYPNFAEHAPIGVALINPQNFMEFANEAWYAYSQHFLDCRLIKGGSK